MIGRHRKRRRRPGNALTLEAEAPVPRLSRRAALAGAGAVAAACTSTPLDYLVLPVDENGAPPAIPYPVQASRPPQALLLLGTVHSRDPDNPMFAKLESLLRQFSPEVIVNEGVPPRSATDRRSAIQRGGDVGFTAFLARELGAHLISGDLPEREEFGLLLEVRAAEEVLVFLVVQRLLVGLNGDLEAAAGAYPDFRSEYLLANGVPDDARHHGWAGFLSAFRRVQGIELTAASWDPYWTSPLRRTGPLSDISRQSHRIRDARLCEVIRQHTALHERVAVTFGAWHVLAIEPLVRRGALFGSPPRRSSIPEVSPYPGRGGHAP